MRNIFILILIAFTLTFVSRIPAVAQTTEPTSKNVIWYVWVDYTSNTNGQNIRLVSAEPITITCCPQSAKYRKFVSKAAKWIEENTGVVVDESFSLAKIQDHDLALTMIEEAKVTDGARIIEYTASCK